MSLLLGTSDKAQGNDIKLHKERLRLDMRKNLFHERVVKHWNRLFIAVVEVLKKHMAMALEDLG